MPDLDAGLTEDELVGIETTFGFRFPPDLRALLGVTLPVSRGWLDWRNADRAEIAAKLAAPFDGVAPYFRNYEYWLSGWGPRPAALDDRMRFLANVPVLIPIAGQHYMAAEPCEPGNPVFSILGIDIIVPGCDLDDYLAGGPRSIATKGTARHIRFWSDIVYEWWPGWLDLLRREVERMQ